MQVLAHPDPFVIEAALLDLVAEAQADDTLGRVLVIVPTSRLATHVERRVAERHGARLGLEVLVHRAVAYRILEEARAQAPEIAPPVLLEALLRRVLARRPRGALARFVAERPGAIGAVLETSKDLREAGISPEALAAEARSSLETEVAEVYAGYSADLERLATKGLVDEAGLVRAALPHAAAYARRRRAILHHGAYELIGVHLDLVRRLETGAPLTFLLPAGRASEANRYAADYASAHLLRGGEPIRWLDDREGGLLGRQLSAPYDEDRAPEPLPESAFAFRDAQGARAELDVALRSALRATADGTPAEEIAIVARDLAPYAPALEAMLEDERLPCSTSLRGPLRRDPAVRDLLLLLDTAAEGFPRGRTAEWLQSRALRLGRLAGGPVPGDLAEDWSRRAGILGGLDGWTRQLAAWAGRTALAEDASEERRAEAEAMRPWRLEQAGRIGAAVEAVARRCEPGRARRFHEHAVLVRSLALDLMPEEAQAGRACRALLDLLDAMERLDNVLGDDRAAPFGEMVGWLERAVDGTDLPTQERDTGGVRVLDAMQARGLTHERVVLVGMHSGVFPRRPREDPLLRDAFRRRLRDTTGRPLPIQEDAAFEERQLLALLLGSARSRIEVSRQRADEAGKAVSPSVALREVARLLVGRPNIAALHAAGASLPVHPRSRIEKLEEWFGMLSEEEARLLRALRGRPEPSPGAEMLRATESFAPGDGRYDARIGRSLVPDRPLSATALETLGRCPLQYFFERGLGIRALEEAPSAFALDPREMGSLVHELLAGLYRSLQAEGLFAEGGAGERVERARRLFPDAWAEATEFLRARLSPVAPFFLRVELERWRRSLLAFIEEDLSTDAVPEGFEVAREETLDLGEGRSLPFRGRFDRLIRGPRGPSVADYKTSAWLTFKANAKEMLKAQALQVPMYRLLAGGARVELLGVGPAHDPAAEDLEDRRVVFEGFGKPDLEAGFLETLRVLAELLEKGRFPLHRGRHCGWCAYEQACRRNHPPTRNREAWAVETADYRLVLQKNTRQPTLDRVRPKLDPDEEDDE